MIVRIDGKDVEVRDAACPYLACLRVGFFTHHNAAGASGVGFETAKYRSCMTRDARGCPETTRLSGSERFHAKGCAGGRYPCIIRTPRGSRITCLACRQLIPRAIAFAEQRIRMVNQ